MSAGDSPVAEITRAMGAIDLGGTKIYSAVVDGDLRIMGEDLRPTDAGRGPAAVVERMAASLQAASASAGIPCESLAGIGVAAPGPVEPTTGMLIDPANLPGWEKFPLGAALSQQLGLPAIRVVIENDANAAALGEYVAGSGRGSQAMAYVTVSTGIGGGLVLGGQLYRGATGAAGEIGHTIVQPRGALCGCGQLGCLEALASGTALMREGRNAVDLGRAPILQRLVAGAGGTVTAELVAQAAEAGDTEAASIITRAGEALGLGLGNLVNVLNPDVIVIGGGAARIGKPLLDSAEKCMRSTIFAASAQRVVLKPAMLEYAAIAGLAALLRSGPLI
jgi:glucokinase